MATLRIISTRIDGASDGQTYPLPDNCALSFGRSPDNDIQLLDTQVSRRHCRIVRTAQGYTLADLDSNNGTEVNDRPIKEHALKDGDLIRVGGTVFRFEEESGAPRERKSSASPKQDVGSAAVDDERRAIESSVRVSAATFLDPCAPIEGKGALFEAERVLGILCRMADALPRAADRADLLELSMDFAMEMMRADRGFIGLVEGKGSPLNVTTVRPHEAGSEGVSISRTIAQQAMDTETAILTSDALDDRRFRQEMSVKAHRIRSAAYVPLKGSESILGLLAVDTTDPVRRFSPTQLNRLCVLANHVAVAIENLSLQQTAREKERLEAQLQAARDIQRNFLPKSIGRIDGLDYAVHFEPVMAVGGDLYDWLRLPDGKVLFAIGDVSGKGIPAALAMSRTMGNLRFLSAVHRQPAQIMEILNESVSDTSSDGMFVAVILVVFDPATGVAEVCVAGHQPPILYRSAAQAAVPVDFKRGIALGVVEHWKYQTVPVSLAAGDVLLLCTDGVTEAENADGEFFQATRVQECLSELADRSADEILDGILQRVDAFIGDQPREDDTTILALKRTHAAAGS
ncbi:MAG: SpoIIE family protein phosphatase [Planctomycetota bacterium]